jgi:pimeloyl-ACP methyl ester carboxylesterase
VPPNPSQLTRPLAKALARGAQRPYMRPHVQDPGLIGTVLWLVTGVVALFIVGVIIYVFGSFLLMRAHTEPRPWGAMMREAAREIFWTLLIQPLLPIGYFLGHRLGDGDGRPVVFVHGYTQNRVNFLGLARALRRARLGPLYGFNYPWHLAIDESARRLGRFIERVCAETKTEAVDIVAHSMGGLVALEHLHLATPPRVRKLVTIAGPHGGVAWRGPVFGRGGASLRRGGEFLVDRVGRQIAIPVLSIYSTHDNIVHPPSTSSLATRGGKDAIVSTAGHLAILFDPQVAREVISFLGDPQIQPQIESASPALAPPDAMTRP